MENLLPSINTHSRYYILMHCFFGFVMCLISHIFYHQWLAIIQDTWVKGPFFGEWYTSSLSAWTMKWRVYSVTELLEMESKFLVYREDETEAWCQDCHCLVRTPMEFLTTAEHSAQSLGNYRLVCIAVL